MRTEQSPEFHVCRGPLTEPEAEDCLVPLAEAGDALHDYLVGTAALIAKGAGDWVDVLEAINDLSSAQRHVRSAHQHLINAMVDQRVRLGDPLEALPHALGADPRQPPDGKSPLVAERPSP